jgi:hypothetical protein
MKGNRRYSLYTKDTGDDFGTAASLHALVNNVHVEDATKTVLPVAICEDPLEQNNSSNPLQKFELIRANLLWHQFETKS